MPGQYHFDTNGIYRCRRCGQGFEVGHSTKCKGSKTNAEIKEDKKAKDEKTAIDLATGFDILNLNDE